jgi:hypothetical protein
MCAVTDLGLELCELEASAVELEDVDRLGRVGLRVRGGRRLDAGRVLSLGDGQGDLAVLALPDKVGLAAATAHFVHLEAAERDPVGVCLAT